MTRNDHDTARPECGGSDRAARPATVTSDWNARSGRRNRADPVRTAGGGAVRRPATAEGQETGRNGMTPSSWAVATTVN